MKLIYFGIDFYTGDQSEFEWFFKAMEEVPSYQEAERIAKEHLTDEYSYEWEEEYVNEVYFHEVVDVDGYKVIMEKSNDA